MRPIPHKAHRKFVETEGWEKKGKARPSAKTGDHVRYTLTLATGDMLYTRVSHGSGRIDDPNLVAAILLEELQVTDEDFFWACINRGILPPRPKPQEAEGGVEELDANLVRNLIRKVGLSPDEIERLTKEEAVQRWHGYSEGGT